MIAFISKDDGSHSKTDGFLPFLKVSYKENRLVLFNSNLFHETDQFHFKPGYKNRRNSEHPPFMLYL